MGSRIDLKGKRFGKLIVLEYSGNGMQKCICDCGNIKMVKTGKLNAGEIKSCGCLKDSDISGEKFGRWTVIKRVGELKQKNSTIPKYLCRCDCGTEKIVLSNSLKNGSSLSCGCYRLDRIKNIREKDLAGKRFGRWVALESYENGKKKYWKCECDCGKISFVREDHLLSGKSKSCGCLTKEVATTHGLSRSRIYGIWQHILSRCENPNSTGYLCYGGRGIQVCNEWHDFSKFYKWAIDNGYTDELSIDRIDVNGNYCPENCRWATMKEQGNNRRNNHYVSIGDERHTLKEWSEISGVPYGTISNRLSNGWNVQDAIFIKVGEISNYDFINCGHRK